MLLPESAYTDAVDDDDADRELQHRPKCPLLRRYRTATCHGSESSYHDK